MEYTSLDKQMDLALIALMSNKVHEFALDNWSNQYRQRGVWLVRNPGQISAEVNRMPFTHPDARARVFVGVPVVRGVVDDVSGVENGQGLQGLNQSEFHKALTDKYGLHPDTFTVFSIERVADKKGDMHIPPELVLVTTPKNIQALARQVLEKLSDPHKAEHILGIPKTGYRKALTVSDSALSATIKNVFENGAFYKNHPDILKIIDGAKTVENYEFMRRLTDLNNAAPEPEAHTFADSARRQQFWNR